MVLKGENYGQSMAIRSNIKSYSTVLKGLMPLDVPVSINESPRLNLTNTSVAHVDRGRKHLINSSCAVPTPTTGDLEEEKSLFINITNQDAIGRMGARISQ